MPPKTYPCGNPNAGAREERERTCKTAYKDKLAAEKKAKAAKKLAAEEKKAAKKAAENVKARERIDLKAAKAVAAKKAADANTKILYKRPGLLTNLGKAAKGLGRAGVAAGKLAYKGGKAAGKAAIGAIPTELKAAALVAKSAVRNQAKHAIGLGKGKVDAIEKDVKKQVAKGRGHVAGAIEAVGAAVGGSPHKYAKHAKNAIEEVKKQGSRKIPPTMPPKPARLIAKAKAIEAEAGEAKHASPKAKVASPVAKSKKASQVVKEKSAKRSPNASAKDKAYAEGERKRAENNKKANIEAKRQLAEAYPGQVFE
jgi:hypothetical protein